MSEQAQAQLLKAAQEAALALAPFVRTGPPGPAQDKRVERYRNLNAAIALATQEGA